MDRNRNRDDDLNRENRGNQVPGVRRDEQMHGSSRQGDRSRSDVSDGGRSRDSMSGSDRDRFPRDDSSNRNLRDDSSSRNIRDDSSNRGSSDELRGGGPDRGGILNDDRSGTNRNQTGSNVDDERSRSTGTPADDRTGGV